jgi:acyl carrier protein
MAEAMTAATPEGQQRRENDVRALVRSIIIELSPDRDERTDDDARLVEDLDFNSLALLELAFTLEDEFDLLPIEETTARQITTLRAVQDHVVVELAGRGEIAGPR